MGMEAREFGVAGVGGRGLRGRTEGRPKFTVSSFGFTVKSTEPAKLKGEGFIAGQ